MPLTSNPTQAMAQPMFPMTTTPMISDHAVVLRASSTSKMVYATRNTPVSIINAVGKFNSPTGLGSQMIQQMAGSDYQVIKMAVMGEVKTHFRPEFVNRIDEVVVFHSLGDAHILSIAKIQIQYLAKRLAAMEMKLDISDEATTEIAKAGFDPVYGARPLKRANQSQIENPLAKQILEGKFAAKDTINADVKRGGDGV